MVLASRRLDLHEFLQLPEEEPSLEFEEGMVSQKVSPKGRHSRLQFTICDIVNHADAARPVALAFPELRVTFGGRSYVPDVSLYLRKRIPVSDRGQIGDVFTIPPDIAFEIVSPEQSTNALIRRCVWYVTNGVRIAVLVDPSDESVVIFRRGELPTPRHGVEQIDLGEILSVELTPQRLFNTLNLE